MIIGYVAGLFINFSSVDESLVSGTINKVDKYRNIKVSEADIQLKKDLVSDTATLRKLKNYITFHYLDAVKLDTDIQQAIAAANADEGMSAEGAMETEELKQYGQYLGNSRLCFLTTLGILDNPDNADPSTIRHALNQVNNVIAQKNYRNRIVLAFIDQCETFLASKPKGEYKELRKVHDILSLDLFTTSGFSNDKIMQKILNKKQLLTNCKELAWYEKTRILQVVAGDIQRVGAFFDEEKMQAYDNEQLKALDAEKIGIIADAEMQGHLGAGELGAIGDLEKLGPFIVADVQNLADVIFDMDKLGLVIGSAESVGNYILDAERMGYFDWDAEKMGFAGDLEKLGFVM